MFVSDLPTTETDLLSQLDEPRPPQINIGRDHQVDIPELCNNRIDLHRVPEQLLWDPGINDALDDNEGNNNIYLLVVFLITRILFRLYLLLYSCILSAHVHGVSNVRGHASRRSHARIRPADSGRVRR